MQFSRRDSHISLAEESLANLIDLAARETDKGERPSGDEGASRVECVPMGSMVSLLPPIKAQGTSRLLSTLMRTIPGAFFQLRFPLLSNPPIRRVYMRA